MNFPDSVSRADVASEVAPVSTVRSVERKTSSEINAPSKSLVVISHYDRRPLRDLRRLLKSMADHDAGSDFDVCVVVNRESGRDVDLPEQPFPVQVCYRANVGMNIGAWDHGWRENPGYDSYVFLQDECVIRRSQWLQGMLRSLAIPGTGMVGESINDSWCRTWSELTAEDSAGDEIQNSKARPYARRARLCLEFMRARNISAGLNGQHLRSLVWAFSGQTLRQLGGFPLGRDYDECIAAEVAVSRHIVDQGLALRQAHRTPFYYVVHSQWINTYPGFSTSLGYSNWARQQFSLPSFPFVAHVGKGDTAARIDQLVKRVETERGLFDEGVLPVPGDGFAALLVLLVDRPPSRAGLERTVLSWCLQSAPHTDVLLVATEAQHLEDTRQLLLSPEMHEFSKLRTLTLAEWADLDLSAYHFVLFGKMGDQFHPSLVTALTLLDQSERPDIIFWNEQKTEPGGHWLFRQPRFEPQTIRHFPHIGLAFAVRPRWLKEFPYDLIADLLHNKTHLFHIWLSQQQHTRWVTHPEVFTRCFRRDEGANGEEISLPKRLVSDEGYWLPYREIMGRNGHFYVLPNRNGQLGAHMVPVQRANTVSVIVSFRDRAQETVACLRSLIQQHFPRHLEIILINNRSSETHLSEIREAAEAFRAEGADIQLVDYDGPFNHSRQTNLGVHISTGDVLLFLNNDAELLDTGVLEEMAAWALVPGIGTVSCQIRGENNELLCAGIRVRALAGSLQASPVEESRDEAGSDQVREVVANTFACAAISRRNFDEIGRLNETEFPNGYNDVEYCLRARNKEYRHLYLGHLRVRHTPGTSRGRTDESFQKLLLRQRYAELSTEGLFQMAREWIPDETRSATPVVVEEPPVGMKKALKVLYRAMIYWVQRRILS